jgi:hypothetical protein
VTIPQQLTAAGVLRAPSIAWQETAADWIGPVPRLWLAAEVQPCNANNGQAAVVRLAPGAGAVDVVAMPAVQGECQTMPQWLDHPTSLGHVALGWLDTHPSVCATGRAVVALAGTGPLSAGGATACLPIAGSRPSMWLTAMAPGDAGKPIGLSGFISRTTASQWWASYGSYPTEWGAVSAVLPLASEPLAAYTVQWGRSATVSVPPLAATALVANFLPKQGGSFEPYATVQLATLGPGGAPSEPQTLVSGLDLLAQQVRYVAVEASWDGDSQRLGLLVSGTLTQNGVQRGFLAFARAAVGQAVASPSLWQLTDAKLAVPPVIHALRIAEIPGSVDFLLAWVMPGSSELWLARIKPLNDKKYVVVTSAIVASDVLPPPTEPTVVASGGLSELLIAPKAQRYSIAYESATGVRLLTAPLPK